MSFNNYQRRWEMKRSGKMPHRAGHVKKQAMMDIFQHVERSDFEPY
jgi:hypothetical protein